VAVVTLCTYVGGFAEASDKEAAAQLETYRRYVEMAQLLDCRMVRLWPDRRIASIHALRQDHWLRAAHYLSAAANVGLREGTQVLLENHEYMTITPGLTLRLLQLIDRPNVVVNFDPGNMAWLGAPYGRDAVLRLRPFIGNVQVKEIRLKASALARIPSDAPSTLSTDLGEDYDLLLGEGNLDHRSYLGALIETGYDGFYMAECHKEPAGALQSDQLAAREIAGLRRLLDEAAAATPPLSPANDRSRG
jgi:sugar phosphate isomerase/epimerase